PYSRRSFAKPAWYASSSMTSASWASLSLRRRVVSASAIALPFVVVYDRGWVRRALMVAGRPATGPGAALCSLAEPRGPTGIGAGTFLIRRIRPAPRLRVAAVRHLAGQAGCVATRKPTSLLWLSGVLLLRLDARRLID